MSEKLPKSCRDLGSVDVPSLTEYGSCVDDLLKDGEVGEAKKFAQEAVQMYSGSQLEDRGEQQIFLLMNSFMIQDKYKQVISNWNPTMVINNTEQAYKSLQGQGIDEMLALYQMGSRELENGADLPNLRMYAAKKVSQHYGKLDHLNSLGDIVKKGPEYARPN